MFINWIFYQCINIKFLFRRFLLICDVLSPVCFISISISCLQAILMEMLSICRSSPKRMLLPRPLISFARLKPEPTLAERVATPPRLPPLRESRGARPPLPQLAREPLPEVSSRSTAEDPILDFQRETVPATAARPLPFPIPSNRETAPRELSRFGQQGSRLLALVAGILVVSVGVGAGLAIRRMTSKSSPPLRSAPAQQKQPNTISETQGTTATPDSQEQRPHRGVSTSAIIASPSSLQDLLRAARDLAAHEDHRAALQLFARALAQAPNSSAAAIGYAKSGVELGDGSAPKKLATLTGAARGSLQPMLSMRLAMVRGNWRLAERRFRALSRRERSQLQPMIWMAEIWRQRGRVDDARRIYLHVLKRDPRLQPGKLRALVQIGISELLYELKSTESSAKYAREALREVDGLQIDPLEKRIRRQLERCHVAVGS